MDIKLYNSMSNSIEVFKPLVENEVSAYCCGPTVYNYAHIGNMRPVVTFDILRRMFSYLGYKVSFVSNITDVDDKIINRAIEEKKSEKEVADFYTDAYFDCYKKLNAKLPDYTPHVVENMEAMIDFINKLVEKGYAYNVDGDVFFEVSKAKHYGKLGHFDIEDLKSGARIEENSKKKNPLDFALWKKTEVGIQWDSPWGKGRPGWHTECVVMINNIFKKPLIDIHGGGFDLKFPHHENEIAQSRACNDSQLSNYWIHNGFVDINNEKMSKSIGNVIWAKDMIEKIGGNATRIMLISAHYRAPLNIINEVIEASISENNKIETALRQAKTKLDLNDIKVISVDHDEKCDELVSCLADDLNTSNALSLVYASVKELNIELRKNNLEGCAKIYASLVRMLDLLGLKYEEVNLTNEDKELFNKWNEYKKNKDFANADIIREELIKRGLI